MPNQISNAASLTFEYGSQIGYASSNTAITTLRETISMSKTSLGSSYYLDEGIFYTIAINNNNNSEINNVKISDNLGSYFPNYSISNTAFTPFTYVGPANLYLGGTFYSEIEPEIYTDKVVFTIPSIPARSNALIIYKVSVNDRALLAPESEIVNTATLSLESILDPITASNTLTVANTADVKIIKHMCPDPVTRGEKITYSFSLYNYGNTEAVNVVFSDTFSPAPSSITVAVNSENLFFSDYSYINGTLTIPAYGSTFSLSIPPAEFVQNPVTGIVSISPGITTITVTGQL